MADEKNLVDDIDLADFNFDDLLTEDDAKTSDIDIMKEMPEDKDVFADMSADDINIDDMLGNAELDNPEVENPKSEFGEQNSEVKGELSEQEILLDETPLTEFDEIETDSSETLEDEAGKEDNIDEAEVLAEDVDAIDNNEEIGEEQAEVEVGQETHAVDNSEMVEPVETVEPEEQPLDNETDAGSEEVIDQEGYNDEDYADNYGKDIKPEEVDELSDEQALDAHREYFADEEIENIQDEKNITNDMGIEEVPNAYCIKWYSGELKDKVFEIGKGFESGSFEADEECNTIHVNVGYDTYGWEVQFSDGVVMSLRDVREYQIRNGRLPAREGRIIFGQSTLNFSGVERIVVYESVKYFSYGV